MELCRYKKIDLRPSVTYTNRYYHAKEFRYSQNGFGRIYLVGSQHNRTNFAGSSLRRNVPPIAIRHPLNYRLYSSFFGGKGDTSREPKVPAISCVGVGGSDWVDMFKDAWLGVVDAIYIGERAREASTKLKSLDAHPHIRDVVVLAGFTSVATMLAWLVLPRLLRRLHKYSMQGQRALFSWTKLWRPVSYKKSSWAALEDLVRYLIIFMAFLQMLMMVSPPAIVSQCIVPAWRGAVSVSFVWFLHQLTTNVFASALATYIAGTKLEPFLFLEKVFSVVLFVLGFMALAEACGLSVQSVMTDGDVGGVVTSFAVGYTLEDTLYGFYLKISKPFLVGDTIEVGSREGQVVKIGVVTTLLISKNFPMIFPNSVISNQIIVNKSRRSRRSMITKIPLQHASWSKILLISEDIRSMLRSNPKVCWETEPPYCFPSQIEGSYIVLTLECNLKRMRENELYSTQQDIFQLSVQIIKQYGVTLGNNLEL